MPYTPPSRKRRPKRTASNTDGGVGAANGSGNGVSGSDASTSASDAEHTERTAGQSAFAHFMSHANSSSSSVLSRRKFYLAGNNSTGSFSESEEPRSGTSGTTGTTGLTSPSLPVSALPTENAVFPLNRIVSKGPSVAQTNALHTAERRDKENQAVLFTTQSPQSYSYALLSPNSMALRLKVLKRSLEILLERPEWLAASGAATPVSENAVADSPVSASLEFFPPPALSLPAVDRRVSSSSSASSTTARSAAAGLRIPTNTTTTNNMPGSPVLSLMSPISPIVSPPFTPPRPAYGGIPMRANSYPTRRASTMVNVMDNVIQLERIASHTSLSRTGSIDSTESEKNQNSDKDGSVSSGSPPQSRASFSIAPLSPQLSSVAVDQQLLQDLKQIIEFLESGISPELSEDQARRMVKLHNLSLASADMQSKKTSLRIQLLHALATPFEEHSSTSSVGGIPMLRSTMSTMGLAAIERSQAAANAAATTLAPRQFHASSAGKTKSPKAIFTCELESPWKLLNSNDLACLMFGISSSLVKSLTLMDLISPRSRGLVFNRLQRHSDQVFSGEVIAIKRNNDAMAWTSLWAKRKGSFIVLIFEQVPCDSLDVIMESFEGDFNFTVSTAKSESAFFDAKNFRDKSLATFMPTVAETVQSRHVPKEFEDLPEGRRTTELINKVRYFTILVDGNYVPCAVASEELDPDDEESEIRLNIHSLPYMAGSFVVSSHNHYSVVSFNEAIAKNLFGHADFQNESVDCILPGFSALVDAAVRENPGLPYEEGLVLPEHYWRKMYAYAAGDSEQDKEMLFLRSTGIDGLHNDGKRFKVDVQVRIIDKDYLILWITYSRSDPMAATSSVPTPSVSREVSDPVRIADITKTLQQTKLDLEEQQQEEEHKKQQVQSALPQVNSVVTLSDFPKSDVGSVPSQLPLFVEQNVQSTAASGDSRTTLRADTPGTSEGSSDSLPQTGGSSSTNTSNSNSNSNAVVSSPSPLSSNAYKLQAPMSQNTLLEQENEAIEEIRKHSKYFPQKVGLERRTKKMTDFDVVKNLGQGAYGKVVIAARKGDPNYKVVMKAIFKERILVDTWVRDKDLGTIPSEIQILNAVSKDPHPNIMGIVDFFEDDNCYYLETLQHGDPPAVDLFELIEVKTDMTELECKYIFFQCSSALAHLHKHGIVHRDIKDENIIVDKSFVAKLIDFGSAAYTKDGPFGVFVGTIDYAAPEVLNGRPYGGKPQDVWAMGVLLYTLVFKENPFCSVDEILEANLTFPRFHNVSEDCLDLIRSILIKDVNRRPHMKDIMQSKWLSSLS